MVPSNLKIGEWTYEATGSGKKNPQQTNKKPKQTEFPQHKKPPKNRKPTPAPPQQKTIQWSTGILSRNRGITASSMEQRNAIYLPNLSEPINHLTMS